MTVADEQPEPDAAIDDAPTNGFGQFAEQLSGHIATTDWMSEIGGKTRHREELGTVPAYRDGGLGLKGRDADGSLEPDHEHTSQPISPT